MPAEPEAGPLERIFGLGYLNTQLKMQVHFLMLVATGSVFTVGVALFIADFFRHAPRFEPGDEPRGAQRQTAVAVGG